MERFVEVQGVRVPRFIYGTAWKEHRTDGLTRLALEVGFRGIDTANQRKHYFEGRARAGPPGAVRSGRAARASPRLPRRTVTSPGGSGPVASGTP